VLTAPTQQKSFSDLRGFRARSLPLLQMGVHNQQGVIEPGYPPVPFPQEVYLVQGRLLRADFVQQLLHLELEVADFIRGHSFKMMRVQEKIPLGHLARHAECAAAHKISHFTPLT